MLSHGEVSEKPPPLNKQYQVAWRRPIALNRITYQREDVGSLSADTHGSTATTSVHNEVGSAWLRLPRRPHRTVTPLNWG